MADYFRLISQPVRELCVQRVLEVPDGWTVRIQEPKRSGEQNDHFHAIISEIAEAELLYGKKLPAESWKRVLIDAFKHETKDDPELKPEWAKFGSIELVPALNHPGFVMVGEQSRRFTKTLAKAFITWLQAFQDGVR